MKITGDTRPSAEFKLETKPGNVARAAFIAVTDDGAFVSRRATDLFCFPDDTPVVANWHGQHRTDAFAMTVGELKSLSLGFE